MSEPLLTVGIPTLDRSNLLDRAIRSLLGQRVPVKILVSDQGKTEATARITAQYKENPLVKRIDSSAESLWQNWRLVAKAADTPFFSFLQDDDVVAPGYSDRIIRAFEQWPEAHCWVARLAISADGISALWYAANGCQVPMDLLTGRTSILEGKLFAPVAYCTSMALSPAVAFRTGPEFSRVLDDLPDGVDLYTERLILAAMGERHPIVTDPFLAGYWCHHGANACYRQRKNQDEQCIRAMAWLDDLMDRLDEWKYPFRQWVDHLPLPHMAAMGGAVFSPAMEQSRYCEDMRKIFNQAARACNQPQSGMPPEFGPVMPVTDIMEPNKMSKRKMPPTVEPFECNSEELVEVVAE